MLLAPALILLSGTIGAVGDRVLEGFSGIEAIDNAAMILGGMAHRIQRREQRARIGHHLGCRDSGIVLLAFAGLGLGPWADRLLSRLQPDARSLQRPVAVTARAVAPSGSDQMPDRLERVDATRTVVLDAL